MFPVAASMRSSSIPEVFRAAKTFPIRLNIPLSTSFSQNISFVWIYNCVNSKKINKGMNLDYYFNNLNKFKQEAHRIFQIGEKVSK